MEEDLKVVVCFVSFSHRLVEGEFIQGVGLGWIPGILVVGPSNE